MDVACGRGDLLWIKVGIGTWRIGGENELITRRGKFGIEPSGIDPECRGECVFPRVTLASECEEIGDRLGTMFPGKILHSKIGKRVNTGAFLLIGIDRLVFI